MVLVPHLLVPSSTSNWSVAAQNSFLRLRHPKTPGSPTNDGWFDSWSWVPALAGGDDGQPRKKVWVHVGMGSRLVLPPGASNSSGQGHVVKGRTHYSTKGYTRPSGFPFGWPVHRCDVYEDQGLHWVPEEIWGSARVWGNYPTWMRYVVMVSEGAAGGRKNGSSSATEVVLSDERHHEDHRQENVEEFVHFSTDERHARRWRNEQTRGETSARTGEIPKEESDTTINDAIIL